MTFGEIVWLFCGAVIGAIAACAIPYTVHTTARMFGKADPLSALENPAFTRATSDPKPLQKSGHDADVTGVSVKPTMGR